MKMHFLSTSSRIFHYLLSCCVESVIAGFTIFHARMVFYTYLYTYEHMGIILQRVSKCQSVKVPVCRSVRVLKYQSVKATECQSGRVSMYQSVKLSECQGVKGNL